MNTDVRKHSCIFVTARFFLLAVLHDQQFNRKSFTTAHTGYGVPYAMDTDHSDVPRSAARPLRYMDRYVTVKQGEVFFITEALATLEGMEKIPCSLSSTAGMNDFRPVPYEEGTEEYERAMSKLDGTYTGPDLNIDYSEYHESPSPEPAAGQEGEADGED